MQIILCQYFKYLKNNATNYPFNSDLKFNLGVKLQNDLKVQSFSIFWLHRKSIEHQILCRQKSYALAKHATYKM